MTKASLALVLPDGTKHPAIKYAMIRRGPQFKVTINGVEGNGAANTTFVKKDKTFLNTAFQFNGSEFVAEGVHLTADQAYTFEYPEGYDFTPPTPRREKDAKAKAKAAEKAAADPAATGDAEGPGKAPESPPEGPNATAEGSESVPAGEAPESAPAPTAPKGRKASR
jgi:hypothetical protein